MSSARFALGLLALALVVPAAGCQLVSRNQLTACEAQTRELSEQSKAQLAEIANLKAHNRTVENRLMKAEEELALLDERAGLDKQKMSNYEYERDQVGQELEGLVQTASFHSGPVDPRLRDLCRRCPDLKLDPKSGLCKLKSDVQFTSGEASLPPDARRQLDQLAQLLKTPQARDLRVMVVGHTDSRTVGKRGTRDHYPDNWHLSAARALNVAEYLQRAGLREDQVGIAGYGRHQPVAANETEATRMRNRRVEIFITGPETPIVGWTETATNLYR